MNPNWGSAAKMLIGPISIASVRVVAQALQFGVFVLAARTLSVAEFGIFSVVFAVVAGFSVLAEGGLREYAICCDNRDSLKYINGLSLFAGGALAVLLLIGSALLWQFGLDVLFASTTALLSLWILLRPTTVVQTGLLTRDGHLSSVSVIQLVSEIAGFAVSVLSLFAGFGILALAFGKVALQFTELGASLATTRWYKVARPEHKELEHILQFSRRILAVRMMQFFQSNFSTIIIGMFLAPVAVGLYRAAVRIAGAANETIREPARFVGWSALRAARERDGNARGQQLPDAALRYTQILFLIAGPILLTLGLMAQPLITVLLGPKWLSAAPIILPLTLAACARLLASVVEPLLSVQGTPEIVQRNAAIITAMGVMSLCAALPFGIIWVAWAEFAAAIVSVPLTAHTLQKHGHIPFRKLLMALCPVLVGWAVCAALILWGNSVGPVNKAPVLAQAFIVGLIATTGYLIVVIGMFRLLQTNGMLSTPWKLS